MKIYVSGNRVPKLGYAARLTDEIVVKKIYNDKHSRENGLET